MSTWKINLENQTATSINGITFKLTETNGEYEGVCLNPKKIIFLIIAFKKDDK